MKNFIKSLLSDDTGAISTTRTLMVLFFLSVIVIWSLVCFKTRSLVDIPAGVIAFGGALAALKGVQNFTEK